MIFRPDRLVQNRNRSVSCRPIKAVWNERNNHYKVNGDLRINFNWLQSTMDWPGMSIQNMVPNSRTTRGECRLHPLIHTLACKDPSAKCGSGFFRGKV